MLPKMFLREPPVTRALAYLDIFSVSLLAVAALCTLSALVLWATAERVHPQVAAGRALMNALPHSFAQPATALDQGPLSLKAVAPTLQLPDLRDVIAFHGSNGRPDAQQEHQPIQLSVGGERHSVPANQPIFLVFDRTGHQCAYRPSPNNAPTNLWLTASPISSNQVRIAVDMATDGDKPIQKDPACQSFVIKKVGNTKRTNWHLGKHRVDGGLLARQRSRWYGSDLFFARHGGAEFQDIANKQRIDFGEGDGRYSLYVEAGDFLIWKNNAWHQSTAGEPTAPYPLLETSKVDERLIVFDLWSPGGRNKVRLSLMRSRDMWLPPHRKESLRFVASRTWSQFVLDTGNERLEVRPQDWLLLQEDTWRLIASVEEIDAYIQGQLRGELLVIHGVEQGEDEQMLVGHLFNSSRCDMQLVEIPLTSEVKMAKGGSQAGGKARFLPLHESGNLSIATAERPPKGLDFDETGEAWNQVPKVMRGTVQRELEHPG